jgi:short chain dehydrogenase
MAFDFDGRRVVVAGGSRGIGRSIALAFARAGAGVSTCARGAEDLARTHAEIAAHGRHAFGGLRPRGPGCNRPLHQGGRGCARRHRRPGQQRLGLRHQGRRRGLGRGDVGGHDGDGTRRPRGDPLPGAWDRPLHHQHFLRRFAALRRRPPALRGDEGGGEPLHGIAGGDPGAKAHPGECDRAGLHRIPGREVGTRTAQQLAAVPRDSLEHSLSAAWASPRRSPTWRFS